MASVTPASQLQWSRLHKWMRENRRRIASCARSHDVMTLVRDEIGGAGQAFPQWGHVQEMASVLEIALPETNRG